MFKKLFFLFPFIKFVVKEESMEPLLFSGDTILVNRFSRIKTNDIIVFRDPQRKGKETYLIKQITRSDVNRFFVEGLQKTKSIDSRHFGWIERKDIVGKMILKL